MSPDYVDEVYLFAGKDDSLGRTQPANRGRAVRKGSGRTAGYVRQISTPLATSSSLVFLAIVLSLVSCKTVRPTCQE
jgi:hypothetical protein